MISGTSGICTSSSTRSRSPSPLPESRLGTKDHWDSVYKREAANFVDHGDEGEVWFGDEAVDRMVGWFERAADPDLSGSDEDDQDEPNPDRQAEGNPNRCKRIQPLPRPVDQLAILDLGTGNGNVLFGLVQAETEPEPNPARMMGVDYVEDSIVLARSVAQHRGPKESQVRFATADVLDAQSIAHLRSMASSLPSTTPTTSATIEAGQTTEMPGWDLVLDKGTYDAIALSSEVNDQGYTPVQRYERLVPTLLANQGLLVVCSCNFTEVELRSRFTSADAGLECVTVVPAPTFSFVRVLVSVSFPVPPFPCRLGLRMLPEGHCWY